MSGKRGEKRGCCYILSSGQGPSWEPSREGMYSIDQWREETVTLLEGENKFWYICIQSFFSFFSLFFKTTAISHFSLCRCVCVCACGACQCLWWCLGDFFIYFLFFWLWVSKKSSKVRREDVWNSKSRSLSLWELGTFYAQLLSVQWTMPLTPGQYGG